ncbi:DNA (cytosine-5)-methyltransferase 1 [Cohnella sp. OV330]|uniref:DNA cytosine methyltransferase n=1 Tax=Cohnella sp. OV330 TaxID=1855288 RepID=UPI0008EFBC5E|nr:DNA cytosine methyltransferase [Cohnella sp. OV330]SFA75526.1 DNA (cytosine-5)-methyltransferase 1 [Cohnella sp. OV330]
MRYKFEAIDIFSGCGGVSCGLTLAGFKVKAAVEIDRSAVETYQSYPPLSKVNVLHDDICKLSGESILKAAGLKKEDIYLFAGCPPCQNFSRKNRENKNKSIAERKKLLFEFLRVIEEVLPPFILMENVPGIKTESNKVILDEFLERLKGRYIIKDETLNAADYGVPQIRKRYVLHAVRNDIHIELQESGFTFTLPKPTHDVKAKDGLRPWKTVREAIGDLPAIKAGERYLDDGRIHNHKCANLDPKNIKRMQLIRKNGGSRSCLPDELVLDCHKKKDADGNILVGHKDVYGVMDADKPSPTMTGGCLCYSKGRYGHYEQDRAISIREAARLQTFPDDFIFCDSLTAAGLQIGNAVPIDLVRASGDVLKQAMKTIKAKRSKEKNGKLC